MRFGVNTLIWTGAFDRSHLSLFPRLKERGFDGVEIVVFHLKDFPVAETRQRLEENEMQCTFCTALAADMSGISEDAGAFYAPIGYLPGRRRTEDEWKREVEFLQSLGDTLARNDVTLAIEPLNRFETFFPGDRHRRLHLARPGLFARADRF